RALTEKWRVPRLVARRNTMQSTRESRRTPVPAISFTGRIGMIGHNPKAATGSATAALCASVALVLLLSGGQAPAEEWNFYMHQSAPNFATSRGAKLFTEEIEKATNGALKARLHLAGTLQISASNVTQAVGGNVVQVGDDLFNSGNIPVAGIPRLPMLIQSYEDFAKADAVLKPYIAKAYQDKGSTLLASYTYPLQFMWGR